MGWFSKLTGISTPSFIKDAGDAVADGVIKVATLGTVDGVDGLKDIGDTIQGGVDDLRGKTQERQIEKGMEEQQNLYAQAQNQITQGYQNNQAALQPWQQSGNNAFNSMMSGMGVNDGVARVAGNDWQSMQSDGFSYGGSSYTPQSFTGGNVSASTYNPASYSAQGYSANGYDSAQQGAYDNYAGYKDFDFDYTKAPGYDFLVDENLEAVTNAMAARGLGSGGAEKKALMERANNLAAQDYGNQYSRAMQTHQQNYGQDFSQHQQNYNQFYNRESANQNATNQSRQFNTGAQNTASQFNANANNQAGQFNASAQNQAGQFNAGAQNSANQFNANMGMQAAQFADSQARYADQTGYDRAYQQYASDQAAKQQNFNNLNTLAGYGQWATNTGVNATNNATNAYAALLTGQGDSLLQSNIAKGDAAASGAQGIANLFLTGAGALAGKG